MQKVPPYIISPVNKEAILELLAEVCDPEVPVLSITDLGIVRDVVLENDSIYIYITPTYSGCPAMDMISVDIRLKMAEHGYKNVHIVSVLSPAWTTDWMSAAGKAKLKAYGIAPPKTSAEKNMAVRIDKLLFNEEAGIQCPRCSSVNTTLLSQFGSTACKALYQCLDCKEPFDYFKCH